MKNLTLRFAAVQAAFWMGYCIYISFAAVYLQALGYNNTELGLILATGNLLSTLLAPVLASFVDRFEDVTPARIIPVLLCMQVVLHAGLLQMRTRGTIATVLFIACIACSFPVNSMNLKLYVDAVHRGAVIDYGLARGSGSLFYVMLSFSLGIITSRSSVLIVPYAGLLTTLLQFLAHVLFVRASDAPAGSAPGAGLHMKDSYRQTQSATDAQPRHSGTQSLQGLTLQEFLLRNLRFCRLLFGIAMLFFAHNICVNFMINVVQNVGGGTAEMGYFNAFMAAVEIPVMMMFSKTAAKYDVRRVLYVAFAAFALKGIAIAAAGSIPVLYAAFLLQAPSFALFTAAVVPYVDQTIALNDSAKAQSLAFSMTTVGSVFASVVGGYLYDRVSVTQTLVFAAGIGVAGCAIAASGIAEKSEPGSAGFERAE